MRGRRCPILLLVSMRSKTELDRVAAEMRQPFSITWGTVAPHKTKKHPNVNKSTPKMLPRARNTCLVFAAPNADFATSPDTLKTRIGQGRCQKQALFSTVRGARAPPKDAENPQGPPGGRQEASVRQQAAGPPGGRPEAPPSPSRGERGFLIPRRGYYQNCGRRNSTMGLVTLPKNRCFSSELMVLLGFYWYIACHIKTFW